jgi:hypothetical protein
MVYVVVDSIVCGEETISQLKARGFEIEMVLR